MRISLPVVAVVPKAAPMPSKLTVAPVARDRPAKVINADWEVVANGALEMMEFSPEIPAAGVARASGPKFTDEGAAALASTTMLLAVRVTGVLTLKRVKAVVELSITIVPARPIIAPVFR